jgi:hypothetical protein
LEKGFKNGGIDGIEDGSSLGSVLGLDKGSKDGFEDGCWDSNEDGSSLGVKLSINEGSEDGFKDGCIDGNEGGSLLGVKIKHLTKLFKQRTIQPSMPIISS